jgi:hypothetical protein
MTRQPAAMTDAEMAAIDKAAHEAYQANPCPPLSEEQAAQIRSLLRRPAEPAG